MSSTAQTFRNVSDTAIRAAVYRARETERKDGLFRDPLARRHAGSRGDQIAAARRELFARPGKRGSRLSSSPRGSSFRLLALLPQSNGRQGNRPWSGICLLERRGS